MNIPTMEELMKETGLSKEEIESKVFEYQRLVLHEIKKSAPKQVAKKIKKQDLKIVAFFAVTTAAFATQLLYGKELGFCFLLLGLNVCYFSLCRTREAIWKKSLEFDLKNADQLLAKITKLRQENTKK